MTENQHLTSNDIALCAEAINAGRYVSVSEALRVHIDACPACAAEVMLVSEVMAENEDFALPNSKAKPERKIIPLWQKFAVAISLAASVLGGLYILSVTVFENKEVIITENIDNDVVKSETVIKDTVNDKNQFTDNKKHTLQLALFEPHPELEKLFNTSRGAYRSSDFTIRLADTLVYTSGAMLEWDNPKSETLTVEFFNNKAQSVSKLVSTGNNVKLPLFSEGLYYYKIFNSDYDLLFLGKVLY